jgi:hypothetical protein
MRVRTGSEVTLGGPTIPLTQLAFLPAWTEDLASEAGVAFESDPATESAAIQPALGRATLQAAMFDRRRALGGDDGETVYWVRTDARRDIGTLARRELTRERLLSMLADLRDQTSGRLDVPKSWKAAVDLVLQDPTGNQLVQAVEHRASHEASRLVETAGQLGDVLGGRLTAAVQRARAVVAGQFRREADLRSIEGYEPRQDLEATLIQFLTGGGPQWAIHLLGVGGVGKTMTLRYLSCGRLEADHHVGPFVVATVDFDHLDPRFPAEQPMLLFESLAGQLAFDPSVATSMIDLAREEFLDAAARAAEEAIRGPLTVDNVQVQIGIGAFVRLVGYATAPVVLVLDTTEELAKVYGSTGRSPAIEETFRLLESTKAAMTGAPYPLRVILAGRRWLRFGTSGQRAPLPDFVRVQEVEGYRRAEAERYVRARLPKVDSAGLDALLARSSPAMAGAGSPRYNPFAVASWTGWLTKEPDIDLAAIPLSDDPYVERRIVGRISEPDVQAVAAATAQLGRFSVQWLAPTIRRAGFDEEEAVEALIRQEWIEVVERATDSRPALLQVDEHLQDRLRAVLARQPDLFPLDRAALGQDLRDQLAAIPLREAPTDLVVALVRAQRPREAVEHWAVVEERIASEDTLEWARQVLPRAEAVAVDDAPHLLASLRATRAALAGRAGRPEPDLWRSVLDVVTATPSEPRAASLAARARLALAAFGASDALEHDPQPADIDGAPLGSLAGAVLAWAEGLPPLGSRSGPAVRAPAWWDLAVTRLRAQQGDPGAQTVGTLAAAMARRADVDLIRRAGEALGARRAEKLPLVASPGDWLDWAVPQGLPERCVLAWLRSGELALLRSRWAGPDLARLVDDAIPRLADIDAERLAAGALHRLLSLRPPVPDGEDVARLDRVDAAERQSYRGTRRPSVALHRAEPSLASVLAAGWALLGEPERAETLLRTRIEEAVSAGTDPETVADCQLALVRLYREYRVDQRFWSLGDTTALDADELAAARALVGVDSTRPRPAAEIRSTIVGRLRALELAALADPGPTAMALHALAEDAYGRSDLLHGDMAAVLARISEVRAGTKGRRKWIRARWEPRSPFFRGLAGRTDALASGWAIRSRAVETLLTDGIAGYMSFVHRLPTTPAELAIADPPVQAAEPATPDARRRQSPVRFPLDALQTVPIAVVFALVCGSLGLLARAAGFPLWGVVVLVLVVFTTGMAAFVGTLRRQGSVSFRFSRVQFRVTAGDAKTAIVRARTASMLDGFIRRTGLARFATPPPSLGLRIPPGFETTVAIEGPDAGKVDLPGWRLRNPLSKNTVTIIELLVDEAVGGLPWEQWLAVPLFRDGLTLLWVRTTPDWVGDVAPPGPPLYFGPDNLANERVRRGAATRALEEPPARLVHVVGKPVSTSAGWRIRVEELSMSMTKSAPSSRREGLLSPAALARTGTGVVVLQAPTVDQVIEPLDSRREAFFIFAHEVLAAEASAAIVIPGVNERTATQIVDIETQWAAREAADLEPAACLALTAKVGRLLRDVHPPKDESPSPLADLVILTRRHPADRKGSAW